MERIPKNAWFLLAIAWTAFIFWACSIPGKNLPSIRLFDYADKLIHAIFFFLFVLFWGSWSGKYSHIGLWMALGIGYGFSLEYYQKMFVAGRSFDVWDGVADSAGAFMGSLWLNRKYSV